ncbi:receptor-type tyrosine-protein phosphatase H isoform X2 [Labeo rohita]|uniref:receptor-type tyrosine-protein phosphatase H isoform X2 n=1 Tax=Labeo rohita TaxID=84645 RepID=UPI0021E2D1E4|nr:receptor-type tyrosine-protein phosphatase H isoform X2 [Labeo rohita]
MERVLTLVLLCALSAWAEIPDVKNVTLINRTETTLTFQWEVQDSNYTFVLSVNGINTTIPHADENVMYTVSKLSPGNKYFFKLYTEYNGSTSKGYEFSDVTVPSNVDTVLVIDRSETEITLQWKNVNNRNDYRYELRYLNEEISAITPSPDNSIVEQNVKNLSPGTEYSFMLYTVFENVMSSGYNFSNVTMPSNVRNVIVLHKNDTDLTFQWDVVSNIDNNTYIYILEYGNGLVNYINHTAEENKVTHHISSLIPGTNYSFTLYTEFADLRSTGYTFFQKMTLSDITEVTVTRSQTELQISWNKLNKNGIYNYTLKRQEEETGIHFSGSTEHDVITHTYSSLTPGAVHSFTLFTVVNNAISKGYSFNTITTLNCASFNWTVTNSTIEAKVNGCTHVTAKSSTGSIKNGLVQGNKVNLQDMDPGEIYTVSLFYELESDRLPQCSHQLRLFPNSVSNLRCEYYSGGYGLVVIWDRLHGVVDVVQVGVNKKNFNQSQNLEPEQKVTGLQPAQWYKVTATSFSGAMKSQTVSVNCQTNPAGVIAGVLVFFLLVIIICVAVFVWIRYKKRAQPTKMPTPLQEVESKVPTNKYKSLSLDTFPEHFQKMSRDQNRGFSEEYEDLSSVGIEQSTAAARLPENKDKNRFSNVLAYDTSRVHLITKNESDSDYINANYMPGYGNAKRQYIASQGPLPSTVSDFWRMVWEQKSQGIVMVTNCTESGRVKCEQYWPLDYTPCLYGNLLVTVKSEDKYPSWTLREFNVKNKTTSETRTVKHFHFTAWPDHGVPTGTEELIQFRGLVRQHIEKAFSAGPTVVHCSAGVGRTGTLIALDVLLQQLDKKKEVGIAAFVQQMRLNRPLMVQTESQYVFLHQCIMDTLQPKVMPDSEPLYENSEMIYVNAMAIREFEKGK